MRQSKLFTKTRREAPADEVAKNAQLLIRGGFVHKEMAGVYSYLPLGLRVLTKIENIIREEMDAIGGQEIRMATLHPSEKWKTTGGWDAVDVLFKIQSRTEKEYALGQSEEEIVTPIAQEYALSYKDLPVAIYQIGQKYRDELRAKSGVMRGREFGMKDMYSFHETQEDFEKFYEIVKASYLKAFNRCGLEVKVTEASGGAFSEKLSYEFMALSDAGEDDILYCNACTHCVNVEIAKEKEGNACPKCGKGKLMKARAVEVGNVFDLGQKYPKAFGFTYKDTEGKEQTPIVGCYGFGTSRLVGTIVETFADEKGMVWPEGVAPFAIHLVSLGKDSDEISKTADALYDDLVRAGVEVLYDDRDMRAGEKFADSDLLGIPKRIVVGKDAVNTGEFEVVNRATGEVVKTSRAKLVG
ncbi:MAG: His/Gly/Thr/Pro-type tRNA ligase C-terminal domain-containing protein [Candidatus Parcubacteria bacterium]|nr:His/Gly/Thr/Pro-type tRNA ligase C-terminal domain-containing protein [Candidatus Parcubacteria bacterium]